MNGRSGIVRAALGVLLLAAPFFAQAPEAKAEDRVVARGKGLEVRASEVEPLLIERYAMTRDGRELLRLLISAKLIDVIAIEQGITATEAQIAALWDELDQRARAAGEAGGIESQLIQGGLTVKEFRDYLRLTILQEELTRRALGKKKDAVVTADQQEIWLNQEMKERGVSWPPPPWPDGIAARCGSIEVTRQEFGRTLLEKMSATDVRETCWHLLLLKGIEKRMPDLAPTARREAVEKEMDRRRMLSENANETKGISFEEVLRARGTTVEMLRRDPSVGIAAMSRLWVDKVQGPDGVRAEYVENRDHYEGLFGKSVHTYLIFLVASQYKNELNPRTFTEAEAELERIKGEVESLRQFSETSARFTEEPSLRQAKGDMGWLTRSDPRYPAQIRSAIFDFLGTGGEITAAGCMLGPVRLDTGVALLWLSAVRESPPWEVMAEHVHEELRRRFIEDVMPVKAVEMVLK